MSQQIDEEDIRAEKMVGEKECLVANIVPNSLFNWANK